MAGGLEWKVAGIRGHGLSPFTGTERFAIRRRLGSGAGGVVYEAFDQERQCLVALKLPHNAKDAEARDLGLFKQEFRALAELVHPNLVGLFEVMSHGPDWFFTMERVEGQPFLEALCPDRGPARDFRRLRALLRQVAEGLAALHRIGKLHQDLKPSHVRVTAEDRVVLLDFGFTAGLPRKALGPEVGPATQAYMAPERIGGHTPTEAGDWYSLGVMLYQVLTGTLPFPGDTLSAQIDKLRGAPPAPEELVSGIPADLGALCMELLERKPEARIAEAQVLERLGAVLQPVPRPQMPSRRLRTSHLLISRKAELAVLGRAFERSLQGKAVVVFVHGETGTGKNFLLRRFLRRLKREEPGTVVLVGRCSEEGAMPYKALDGLMAGLGSYLVQLPPHKAAILLPRDIHCLARLFPVLQQVAALAEGGREAPSSPDLQELRRRAFGALRELLILLGTRYPLVLVIEDLQWGDMDSAALLSSLLRDPDPPSMLAVLSYQTGRSQATPALQALQGRLAEEGNDVVRLPVEKIPPTESRSLAMALLGSNRPDVSAEAAWIAQESGGDPFFIGELSRQLRSGIRVPQLAQGGEGHTLDAYIRSRVASLPALSGRILETLVLAGHPVEWSVLCVACRIGADSLELLTPLRAGHLIRARGAERLILEPYHDRIRQSVLRDFPIERAREIHLAMAQAMAQALEPDAQALCLHFHAAGDRLRAGEYALLAADQAVAALAFGRAAEFYRRALRLGHARGRERVEVLVKLGDALAGAGLGHKAAQAYLAAQSKAPAALVPRLQRRASEEYFRSGHFDQGEAVLDTVMAWTGMRLVKPAWMARLAERTCRLRLRLRGYGFRSRTEGQVAQADLDRIDVCWAAAMGLGPVDHVRSGEFQARHLLLALRAGEPFRVVRALALETIYLSYRGNRNLAATQRIQTLTQNLAERIGHPNPMGRALVAAGTSALNQGLWKSGVELLEQAETLLKDNCTGLDFELHLAQHQALLGRLRMGSLRDLEIRLSARLQAAQDKGDLLAITNLRTSVSPHVHLAHDDPARALRELEQAIDGWSRAGFHLQHSNALVSRAEILLYSGDPGQALAVLAGHWKLMRRSGVLRLQTVRVACLELRARAALALAGLQAGPGRAALLARAGRDIRRLEAEGVGYADALARRLLAHEALLLGRMDEAGALLYQAEQAFLGCDMALQAMVVRHRRGRLEGPPGAEQVELADRWMRSQHIANPARFVAAHLP